MPVKIYLFCELFALISCVYNYKFLARYFRIFLVYLVLIMIYEIGNRFKLFIWNHTNAWSDNLESILEITVFGTFISTLHELKPIKNQVRIAVGLGILLYLVDIFFIQGFWKMATIGIVAQCALIVVLICIYYYRLMKIGNENIRLSIYPPFWATMALLFYSLIDFFYYGTFSYMVYTKNFYLGNVVTVFGNLASIMLYVFLGISFFCFRLKPQPALT